MSPLNWTKEFFKSSLEDFSRNFLRNVYKESYRSCLYNCCKNAQTISTHFFRRFVREFLKNFLQAIFQGFLHNFISSYKIYQQSIEGFHKEYSWNMMRLKWGFQWISSLKINEGIFLNSNDFIFGNFKKDYYDVFPETSLGTFSGIPAKFTWEILFQFFRYWKNISYFNLHIFLWGWLFKNSFLRFLLKFCKANFLKSWLKDMSRRYIQQFNQWFIY